MRNVPRRTLGTPPSRSKYRNVKTKVDGRIFASKREAARYQELRLLLRAGEISDLVCQPAFHCVVNGTSICTYISDFGYRLRSGSAVTEDVKGFKTRDYQIKKKLVRALFGVEILET